MFAQQCPAIIPEGSVGEEEVALLAAVTQEQQVPVAFETQPLHVYILECTVPPVFLIGFALKVEEVPLRKTDVAGGLEAEGPSDFDVLITLGEDVFVGDGWVLAFLDPQESLLCKGRGGEQGRYFIDHFQLVGFLYGKHNSIIIDVTFK